MPRQIDDSEKRVQEDRIIAELNSVGLSLETIGKKMSLHPSTIKYRLKGLGLSPADTRRTFMDNIYNTLNPQQQRWLIKELGAGIPIGNYVRKLILDRYLEQRGK